MRIVPLSTSSWLILTWFAASIVAEVIGMLILRVRLYRRGVRLVSGLTGVPGYMEYRYAMWCRERGRSPRRVIVLQAVLLFNMVLAILCALPILSARAG
jgi:hypothetical protein